MSRAIQFSPLALQDLRDAYSYLVEHSPRAADDFLDAAHEMALAAAAAPGIGKRWPHGEKDLSEVRSVRIRGFKAWLLVYVGTDGYLRVLRVIHGARDLDSGFDLGNEIRD